MAPLNDTTKCNCNGRKYYTTWFIVKKNVTVKICVYSSHLRHFLRINSLDPTDTIYYDAQFIVYKKYQ